MAHQARGSGVPPSQLFHGPQVYPRWASPGHMDYVQVCSHSESRPGRFPGKATEAPILPVMLRILPGTALRDPRRRCPWPKIWGLPLESRPTIRGCPAALVVRGAGEGGAGRQARSHTGLCWPTNKPNGFAGAWPFVELADCRPLGFFMRFSVQQLFGSLMAFEILPSSFEPPQAPSII